MLDESKDHLIVPAIRQFLADFKLEPGPKRRFLGDLYQMFQDYIVSKALPYGCTKRIFSSILCKQFHFGTATLTTPGSKPTTQRFFWMNRE
jgi:hypothetical protein